MSIVCAIYGQCNNHLLNIKGYLWDLWLLVVQQFVLYNLQIAQLVLCNLQISVDLQFAQGTYIVMSYTYEGPEQQ